MKQSTRVLNLGGFIFAVLSGLALLLLWTVAADNAEAARRIATVWGGAVGILIPAIAIWWWNVRMR
jgi:hypothetical protein